MTEALKSKPSCLAIITDSNISGLEIIQNNLLELNLENFYDFWICEEIGFENEKIRKFNLKEKLPNDISYLNIAVLLKREKDIQRKELPLFGFKDNTKKEQSLFKSGKLNGQLIKWYENGNKLEEGNYEEGRQNGIWTWYYETGIKKEETQFVDGQQDGLWTQWFPDGQRKSERTFSNGERDNKWTSWYRNGNKKLEANYKNGKLGQKMEEKQMKQHMREGKKVVR